MDMVKEAQLSGWTLEKVVVHPLLLLSTVDHYNCVACDTRKRVTGVLLGMHLSTSSRCVVDVTNSYAVPFEEDGKDHICSQGACCWLVHTGPIQN